MKKIVASLLSVIMLVFACGPVGLAYNFSDGVLTSGTTENDMPTLQAVYMKRNADAPDGTCKFEEDTIGSLKAGDDFYIGLRATGVVAPASLYVRRSVLRMMSP